MRNRIRELREKMSWTQEEMAERVRVTRQTIISLEKGKYNPSIVLAHRIARAFSRNIEGVFFFDEEEGT